MRGLATLPRADVALALVLAAYALTEALVIGAPIVWTVLAPAAMLALAWRHRRPALVIGLLLGVMFGVGLAGTGPGDTVLPLPVIIVAAYTAGREARTGRRALAGTALVGAVFAAGVALPDATGENTGAEDLVALLVLIGASGGAGRVMRLRRAETRRLRELSAQLAEERDLRAQAAVAEERARVARELHDIVAHGISLIAVQAGAAEELLGRDEQRARASLRAVQETARSSLAEMRRLLTVLRGDDDEPGLAPQAGLGALGELVAQARHGGLPVVLREEGERRAVPTGVDLSGYRIVQEALTNVRKHAGSVPTEVLVRYTPEEVALEVSSELTGPPATADIGGHGLTGMHERARIYGGTLDAGPREGRFVVRAQLPLREPVA
jgi:signal transduction histidine kinase